MIRKDSIKKLIKSIDEIDEKLKKVREYFNSLNSAKESLKESSQDRHLVLESVDACENEILMELLDINKISEEVIKKIDKEAWQENVQ